MKKFLLFCLSLCVISLSFLSQTQASMIACTMEAKMCPDGITFVGRTGPNCEFEACPTTTSPSPGASSPSYPGTDGGYACTEEAKTCPDGTNVWRVGPNCEFMACPDTPVVDDGVMCTMDAKECSDGSFVGRVGPNCEFAACPGASTPKACTREYVPVCGQPIMPACPEGFACPQVMPNPTTYSNRCMMESEGATLIHTGKCIENYPRQTLDKIDSKMDTLIQKIDTTFSSASEKISIVNKMFTKLDAKVTQVPTLEGVIEYIKQKLQDYIDML